MKVLFKKLSKVHIVKKIFYFLTSILYITALVFLIKGLLELKGIETGLRIIVIAIAVIWGCIYVFGGLLTLLARKTKTFVFLTFLSILFSPVFIGSSYIIDTVFNGYLGGMNKEELEYKTNLIALKETTFKSTSTLGMIESEDDVEGHKLAKKLIKENDLTNKIKYYEDYHSLITALYKKEIDACFVSGNFSVIFENETFISEDEDPISEKVKIIYEYSESMENQDNEILSASKEKSLTEPFTVLIMGVDSAQDGLKANQAFNGDTLILVTFNPNTLTATMFSIPRDMYVPIACNNNRYNKINSSAGYGSSCVIKTIQQMTGITIDYYLKVNFKGVVQLIDALGGVTVDVEEPDFSYDAAHKGQVCEQSSNRSYYELICMNPGVQTLNGEQALAYARCRHLYATSDIARTQHQQQLIEAAAQKLKTINSLEDFEKILNAVSNNIETNITPEQIMSFYTVGKDMLLSSNKNSTALSIKKTYLSYYSLPIYQPWADRYTSALGYYPGSLDAITTLMKQNLGLEKPKAIKTFDIAYNEDYTTPLTGYGITSGGKLERMPNLFGQEKYYVENWCQQRDINCTFTVKESTEPKDTIFSQSAHEGLLLKPIKDIEFYVSDGKGKTEEEKEEEETDKPENEGNEDKPGSGNGNENTGENEGDNKPKPEPETPTPTPEPTPEPETPTPEPDTPIENTTE